MKSFPCRWCWRGLQQNLVIFLAEQVETSNMGVSGATFGHQMLVFWFWEMEMVQKAEYQSLSIIMLLSPHSGWHVHAFSLVSWTLSRWQLQFFGRESSAAPRRTPEIWPWLRSLRVHQPFRCCWQRWNGWRRWTPRGWWRCNFCDLNGWRICLCRPWGNSRNWLKPSCLKKIQWLRGFQCSWSELARLRVTLWYAVLVERFDGIDNSKNN